CLDIRWALPEEASPPVSDTPKPILIGSCACAEKNAPDNVTAAAISSDSRGRAFSAISILHLCIASSPDASNEPTHRAFDAHDTSDLPSARKQRWRWDRARRCSGPRTQWAVQPNNTFAFSPACSSYVPSVMRARWRPRRALRWGKQRFGDEREAVHSSDWAKGARI